MLFKKKEKNKYYDIDPVWNSGADYMMILGERSNGKTYAALKKALKYYLDTGRTVAYIRRLDIEIQGRRASQVWAAIEAEPLNWVRTYTKGEWTSIYYYSGKWYLAREDEKLGLVHAEDPFAYAFALNTMEHDKSISYPDVGIIIFDEITSRSRYLVDEFVIFMNVISSIVRDKNDVKIIMLGNTIDKYCPYFKEMGLNHIPKQEQGTIEIYEFPNSLKVAVEYCSDLTSSREASKYFAFDNPKLKMITSGTWEVSPYPHAPGKISKKSIQYSYFIVYEDSILQCDIVNDGLSLYTFVHMKTTPLKLKSTDTIYDTTELHHESNFGYSIFNPVNMIQKKILAVFKTGKIFYQDNETGEIMRSYLNFVATR